MCYFKCSKYLSRLCSKLLFGCCFLSAFNIYAATYNPATGELFLPALINGSTTLMDVIIKLNPDGTYQIKGGIEPDLPFLCPKKFTAATFELVKSATTSAQVDALLGCQSSLQSTHVNYASESTPASTSATWYDSKCSILNIGFNESIEGLDAIASLQENKGGCNGAMARRSFYDLQSKVFLITRVLMDKNNFATEVVLKFTSDKHYELLNYSLSKPAELPEICHTLTMDDFNAISADMGPDEISKKLNCQWDDSRISDSRYTSFGWRDHECNDITITEGLNKIFSQKKLTGCSTFNGH